VPSRRSVAFKAFELSLECPHLRVEIWGTRFTGARLCDGERWADEFHAIGSHLSGVVDVGCSAACAVPGVEELFHSAGGGVGDEEASFAFSDEGEGMGDAAGSEDRVACFEVMEFAADLDEVFALEDVEPLVFYVVEVAGWTALAGVMVLHGKEVATTVFGGDFEGGGAVGENAFEVIAVSAAGDGSGGL
jgi:hypothetical protein